MYLLRGLQTAATGKLTPAAGLSCVCAVLCRSLALAANSEIVSSQSWETKCFCDWGECQLCYSEILGHVRDFHVTCVEHTCRVSCLTSVSASHTIHTFSAPTLRCVCNLEASSSSSPTPVFPWSSSTCWWSSMRLSVAPSWCWRSQTLSTLVWVSAEEGIARHFLSFPSCKKSFLTSLTSSAKNWKLKKMKYKWVKQDVRCKYS